MMGTVHRALVLFAASLLLGGCATIFSGTTDKLTFQANVPAVRLTIDGQYRGELPLEVEMSRNVASGQQFLARFERNGYQTQEFKLQREFNTVAILDVSSTIVSGGVDVLTGAFMKFSPRDYHVQMLPEGKNPASSEARRSADLVRFALVNFRSLQKDIARGGGEHLATLATMVGDEDPSLAPLVQAAALRGAPALVAAPSPHAFLERFDGLLVESPALRDHRM